MSKMFEYIILSRNFLWSTIIPVAFLYVGGYLWLSIRFSPFKWLFSAATSLKKHNNTKGITAYQSLTTVLSGTVGTGTIAGVATAVKIGGPGTIFYIWLVAIVGMLIKYCEGLLAIKFRQTDNNGVHSGGPMYYMQRVFPTKSIKGQYITIVYAVACMLSALGIGGCVQSHSITTALHATTGMEPWCIGIILMLCSGIVAQGGIRRLVVLAECIVPVMIVVYLFMCIIVLYHYHIKIPHALYTIVDSGIRGYNDSSLWFGTGLGIIIQQGVSRSVFTHEAGLGSSAFTQAAVDTDNPLEQAGVSMISTIVDTLIMCTLTGLVILVATDVSPLSSNTGVHITIEALSTCIPHADKIITLCAVLFGITTIFTWGYYGRMAANFLHPSLANYFILLWLSAIAYGSVEHSDIVWAYADMANAMMMLPNLLTLFYARPLLKLWLVKNDT